MNAQRQAGGGGYPGGDSRPPLSKKEQKALKKKQARSELVVPRWAGRKPAQGGGRRKRAGIRA
jgi:hypothetical protein